MFKGYLQLIFTQDIKCSKYKKTKILSPHLAIQIGVAGKGKGISKAETCISVVSRKPVLFSDMIM